MVRAQTTTGVKAEFLRMCPPKGEMNEPLCNLRDSPLPSFVYEPGDLLFLEEWEEQPLTPIVNFSEFWEFDDYELGPMQWVEPWEFMVFTLGPLNFLEEWEEEVLTPILNFTEPWEFMDFMLGPLNFLEEWEAPAAAAHAGEWFLSEDFSPLDPAPIVTWGFDGIISGEFSANQGVTEFGSVNEAKIRSLDSGGLPWSLLHTFPSGNQRTDVTSSVGFTDVADTGDSHDTFFVQRTTGNSAEIWTILNSAGFGSIFLDHTFGGDVQRVTKAIGFFSHAWFGTVPISGMDPAVYSYNNADGAVQETFFSGATAAETIVSFLEAGESIALYVGVSHPSGARIYRGQVGGVDGSWDLLHTFTETYISDITAFPTFNGNTGSLLYAAVYSEGTSDPRRIYKSADGASWSLSYTIPDASPALDQITTVFMPSSQFSADPSENLLLGVGTMNTSAVDAKVYGVDITEGLGDSWALSADFNTEFSDPLRSVTALGDNSINGNLYASTGDYTGSLLGSEGVRHYSCPFDDTDEGGGEGEGEGEGGG